MCKNDDACEIHVETQLFDNCFGSLPGGIQIASQRSVHLSRPSVSLTQGVLGCGAVVSGMITDWAGPGSIPTLSMDQDYI